MILVTGASGNVGSALVKQLRAAEVPFRAAYHSAEKAKKAAADGIDAVTVEMSDPATVQPALAGVSKVFLLGAMSPGQTGNESNVVEAAVSAGVSHVVKQSLWRADEELTPIARLHRPVERMLETSPLSWTFLRANFYLQAFSGNWAGTIRSGNFFASPLIRGPIAFVDAEDVARVAFRSLTEDGHAGKAYALSGPEALTYDEAAAVLSEVLGRPIAYRGMSNEQALSALAEAGMSSFHARALVEVCNTYLDGGAETVTSTVEDVTGQRPRSFREFATAHRHCFEETQGN
ncbi:SDR family oxidoreductase [Amycolatopsis sp. FU40]|uniref:SDR family oxidoreductase n=1 Tax=Amycolatopsis sp. FU40 TaxID=2914159 RepID=UPI001F436D13|nr:SDR family oxidoreductase [Amycolatopsis sp. FU40]UKD52334.1 SDR family oxidoreductase [Amycolatopsis sp. FU40]